MITNRPNDPHRPTTTQAIQHENAVRWHVEQFHREVKQLTGTEKCQRRKARSHRIGTPLYDAHRRLWDDNLTAALRQPVIPAVGC